MAEDLVDAGGPEHEVERPASTAETSAVDGFGV
jgi:hypothetical protein